MQTILIVEDDKTIAESIAFILEQDSFNCKWFDNGQDALEYLNNNEVDLILLDVGLPDMSGFDVLRKVREKYSLPVIIISARDDESDQVLGLEGLGANAYVTKPFFNSSKESIKPSLYKTCAMFRVIFVEGICTI